MPPTTQAPAYAPVHIGAGGGAGGHTFKAPDVTTVFPLSDGGGGGGVYTPTSTTSSNSINNSNFSIGSPVASNTNPHYDNAAAAIPVTAAPTTPAQFLANLGRPPRPLNAGAGTGAGASASASASAGAGKPVPTMLTPPSNPLTPAGGVRLPVPMAYMGAATVSADATVGAPGTGAGAIDDNLLVSFDEDPTTQHVSL